MTNEQRTATLNTSKRNFSVFVRKIALFVVLQSIAFCTTVNAEEGFTGYYYYQSIHPSAESACGNYAVEDFLWTQVEGIHPVSGDSICRGYHVGDDRLLGTWYIHSTTGNYYSSVSESEEENKFEIGFDKYEDDEDCNKPTDKVSNPVSTATGNKLHRESIPILSTQSGYSFSLIYNSMRVSPSVLGMWQHNYNRRIVLKQQNHIAKTATQFVSSYSYPTRDEACVAGWNEVKGSLSYSWVSGAYAEYVGSLQCAIKKANGTIWKTIPIQMEEAGLPGFTVADGFVVPQILEIQRPGGAVIEFYRYGDVWKNYIGVHETVEDILDELTQELIGYRYVNNNEVEIYDANGRLTEVTTNNGYKSTLNYDADGLLTDISDSFGRSAIFAYDTEGRFETLTTADGMYVFSYDANNNLSGITYPGNTSKTFVYDDVNWPNALTGIIDENGDRYATYAYNAAGQAILSKHAEDDMYASITYNADGTSTVVDANSESRTYHFETINGLKKITQITGPACQSCGGSAQTTTYDTNGNRDLVTDFNGNVTDYDYDLTRNLEISRIEAKGTAQERTTLTQWHPDYRLKTCVIEPVRTTILDYYPDAMLQTRTEVDTSNATLFPDTAAKQCDTIKARGDYASLNKRAWNYTYDANNLLATVDGPRTDVTDITTYVHNASKGNLESVSNAAGHTTNITAHDASGRPLRIVDANNLVTQLTYTPRGWTDLIKVGTDTVFETTDLDYDGVGQLIKVTLPDGSYLDYDYDAAHRLTDIRDQAGNHIHYVLDAMGNRTAIEVKDPGAVLKRTHSYVFNTLNQLSESIGADKGVNTQKTTYDEYDANGNLKKTTDAQGNITQYGYDAFDRLDNVIDALNGTTSYSYDAMGNLETVTDPRNNVTIYEYDGLGNLTRLTSPDTGITNYTNYDAAGNLNSQTDAKDQTTVYEYDALNRLTQITYADTSTTVYAYDDPATNGIGRLSSITDPSGSTSYAYDPHGRIETKTQTIGSISLPVAYHYNAQGQLDTITYPSGKVISYTYSNGKISQLKVDGAVVLNNISYDPFGPVIGWEMGAGQSPNSINRNYDLDGQLESYTLAGATKTIGYYNTGNISAIQEIGNAANDQSFNYDGLYRLTDYSGLGETHVYGYDANGNRTAQTINGTGYGYTVATNNNRLQAVAGPTAKSYQYDANGNISNDGLFGYSYDARNRLVGLNTGIGYSLNGLGQRVAKTIPAVDPASLSGDVNNDQTVDAQDYSLILNHILGIQTANNADCNEDGNIDVGDLVCVNIKSNGLAANDKTHYVYDEQGQLIGEYDQDGNAIQETVYLGNLPVAVLKDGNVYYIHADHLNTPRAITDAANNAVWSWLSDPFGVTAANEDVDGDGTEFTYNLRFPGQYYDEETGLHYNYFRDYDPSTGRYVQSDPIGLKAGMNTYSYVGGNPILYIDSFGLKQSCRWVSKYEWEVVTPIVIKPAEGEWVWKCSPVVSPTIGIPDPGQKKPGFPGDLEIGINCDWYWEWTSEGEYDQKVEIWTKGYMECTDDCTGEVKTHWGSPRPLSEANKIE